MLEVCEIFRSIQGESSFAGFPCVFVRLSGCNLNCSYCDTQYAKENGEEKSIEDVIRLVSGFECELVEITGGEPLIQKDTPDLCRKLVAASHRVLVETNGSKDISLLPESCIRIVDIKCPGSGEGGSFSIRNLGFLRPYDECKFVISKKEDFDWATEFVHAHGIEKLCRLIFTPVYGRLEPSDLAEWILSSRLNVRLGIQIHKIIWDAEARGV